MVYGHVKDRYTRLSFPLAVNAICTVLWSWMEHSANKKEKHSQHDMANNITKRGQIAC